MRAIRVFAVLAFVAPLGGGCATVDVKGREVLRLGPLRDALVVAASVDPAPVAIDAGTDALTDEELDAIARSLPAVLDGEFNRMAGERGVARVGRAKIDGCKLRAGAGKTATLYVAKCRVKILVDDVAVLAVQTEAVRRTPAQTITETEARELKKLVRNPLLSADDSRVVMVEAIKAAALVVRDSRLPPVDDDPTARVLPAEERARKAALARDRIARPGNPQAALFDLRSSGVPADAARVLPFLASEDPAVRAAAVDALGELCAHESAMHIEPLTTSDAETEQVRASASRALERLRACGTLGSGVAQ